MAYESLGNTGLVRTLSDVLGDLSELVQKEIRFAKAEVTENISFKLKASFWMVAAGLLGLIAALLVIQAIAFAVASFGLALHWSCLLVPPFSQRAGQLPSITDAHWRRKSCFRSGASSRSSKTSGQSRSS